MLFILNSINPFSILSGVIFHNFINKRGLQSPSLAVLLNRLSLAVYPPSVNRNTTGEVREQSLSRACRVDNAAEHHKHRPVTLRFTRNALQPLTSRQDVLTRDIHRLTASRRVIHPGATKMLTGCSRTYTVHIVWESKARSDLLIFIFK